MQAEATILEHITHTYVAYRLVRLVSALSVLSAAILLFVLSGGLPPWSWRMLFQTAPQLPALLSVNGLGVLLAFIGLILLSLNVLLAWVALLWIAGQMFLYWRKEYQERQSFAADIEEAHSIAQEVDELSTQALPTPVQISRGTVFPMRSALIRPHGYTFASAYQEEEEDENGTEPLYPEDEENELEPLYPEDEEDGEALYEEYQEEGPQFAEYRTTETRANPYQVYEGEGKQSVAKYQEVGSANRSTSSQFLQPAGSTSYGLNLPPGISMAPSAPAMNPHNSYYGLFAPFNPSTVLQASSSATSGAPGSGWPGLQTGQVQLSSQLSPLEPMQDNIPTIPLPEPERKAPSRSSSDRASASLKALPRTPDYNSEDSWLNSQAGTVQEPFQLSSSGSTNEDIPTVPLPRPEAVQGHPQLSAIYYEQENPLARPQPSSIAAPNAQNASIQLMVSSGLDAGLKRKGKPNEDSLLALQNTRVLRDQICPVGLFVIADGMGGHSNGQEASRLVVQTMSKTVVPSVIYGPTDDNYAELLAEGVHHANLAIYQRNRQDRGDMGTTIAAALLVNTTAYIANVGDSRVYLYRRGSGLSQVTRDHSTVAQMVARGLITSDEVYTHPRRNEIYRSLGRHPSEESDTFVISMQPEDLLMLCSDGLWEMVRDPMIREIIESTLDQPAHLSSRLVQAALEGGGLDNVSVICIYMKPQEAPAVRAS